MSENDQSLSWGGIPGYAKAIMALQTLVILFLSFWVYQEYQNNQYLQTYVNTNLSGTGFAVLALATITGFSTAAVVLFKKLRQAHRDLDEVLSNETVRQAVTRSPGFLDAKTEQHLVEMIRRSETTQSTMQPGPMPILRQIDVGEDVKTPKP